MKFDSPDANDVALTVKFLLPLQCDKGDTFRSSDCTHTLCKLYTDQFWKSVCLQAHRGCSMLYLCACRNLNNARVNLTHVKQKGSLRYVSILNTQRRTSVSHVHVLRVCEQRMLWRDFTFGQSLLNLLCSHIRLASLLHAAFLLSLHTNLLSLTSTWRYAWSPWCWIRIIDFWLLKPRPKGTFTPNNNRRMCF